MPIRYVVRTLDRPSDLADLLRYLAEFAPQIGLVVIDGSEQAIQERNRVEIARYADRLSVELVPIAPGTPIIERTVAGLRAISDDFVFFGADDDFPCVEFIEQADALIAAGKVAPSDKIFGDQIKLELWTANHIRVKKFCVPDADSDDPMVRIRRFIQHYQTLVYGVFGREALIEEYLMTEDVLMTGPQSYDFVLGERFMGAIAVARGKLHYVPGLSLIRLLKSQRHETITATTFPTLFMPRCYERAWSAVHHLAHAMGIAFDALEHPQQKALVRSVHDLATGRLGRLDLSKNPNWHLGNSLLRSCFSTGQPEHAQIHDRLVFARERLIEGVMGLEQQRNDTHPDHSLLPSAAQVANKLDKLENFKAGDRDMLVDLHSMTMTVPETVDDLQARKERRLTKKQRLARKQGRGQA